ncbi:hypothetical protein AXYL_06742 (plasmid) [Achromobacter xylosoxidans A8]|uniref:Uncharacterized protein n=1 Tax=Achromobacter xylosoxidans (strain A8) TaxID=762376 RepID=E3HY72_ACHXA|nr:hypothetical protein AXYL_06742 [Achromobacter xylosoxidans A8]
MQVAQLRDSSYATLLWRFSVLDSVIVYLVGGFAAIKLTQHLLRVLFRLICDAACVFSCALYVFWYLNFVLT